MDRKRVVNTCGTYAEFPHFSEIRLCRLLHAYGRGLEPGQPVITGSFCHHAITQPGSYRASFSGIGEVSVRFV